MTALASLIRAFAALLTPDPGNDARLSEWITDARAADLPHLHSFTRGLDLDIQAATAALTLPVPQRPHRRRQHQDQDDQEADVRTRRLRPPPPPHPARLTARTVTTESAMALSRAHGAVTGGARPRGTPSPSLPGRAGAAGPSSARKREGWPEVRAGPGPRAAAHDRNSRSGPG